MRRPEGTVFIHFSKFYQENLLTDLLTLKNWYENQNIFHKIHLSFPVFFWRLIQSNEILFFWLSRLIKENIFIYFPNTLSGENHGILSLNEARLDLAWCLDNPEKLGYHDLFGSEPVGIFISGCDLYRSKMQTLYHEYKRYLLLEGIRGEKKSRLLLYREGKQKKAIPLHPLGWQGIGKQLLNFLSFSSSNHSLLYWSPLEEIDLNNFLNNLPQKFFREAPLKKNKRLSEAYLQNLKPAYAETNLLLRSHSFTRQYLRPTLPRRELIKDNLTMLFPLPSTPSHTLKGNPQQILEGETSLSSGNLKLSFRKGQLLGWSHKQKNLPALPPARSYSILPSHKHRESQYHSTSLEQGNLSGIRQVIFSTSGVSSSLDYFPLEEEEGFLINAHFIWNTRILRKNQGDLVPLDLPLYRLEKDSLLKVSVLSWEEDVYERLIPDDELDDILWGECFFFHHSASPLMITFGSGEAKIKFPLSIKTKKIKGYYYLFLNLGGFYNSLKLEPKTLLHQSFSLVISQPSKIPFILPEIKGALRKESYACEIWAESSVEN